MDSEAQQAAEPPSTATDVELVPDDHRDAVHSGVLTFEKFMENAFDVFDLVTFRQLADELAHGDSQEVVLDRWQPRLVALEAQRALRARATRSWMNRGYLRDTQDTRPPSMTMAQRFLSPQFPGNMVPPLAATISSPPAQLTPEYKADPNPNHNIRP